MSLMIPRWYFANEVDNLTGTVVVTPGASIVTGVSNADGSVVSLLTALAFDVHFLVLSFGNSATTSSQNPCNQVDILVDPAGGTNWDTTNILINDLLVYPNGVRTAEKQYPSAYCFPLFIPAGTSIGARGRTAHTVARTIKCVVKAYGEPSRPDQWWCGAAVETLGSTPTGSRGTSITPGVSSAYGSWTSVGGTTSGNYGFVQVGYCGVNNISLIVQSCYVQVGYSSTQLPGTPTLYTTGDMSEAGQLAPTPFMGWCDVPQGIQMQVRAASSVAATPQDLQIALYGVH